MASQDISRDFSRRDFLALGAAALVSPAFGQEKKAAPAKTKPLDEELEPIRKANDVPALAAAVVRSEGLIAVGAVGQRSRGAKAPVTVNDKFHIGSDTKAMTAVVIARLVEGGKLSWEVTLEKALPGLAASMNPAFRAATLTQVLSHHAGLPANLGGPGGWWSIDQKLPIRKQRQEAARRSLAGQPEHAPGSKFLYSNVGYTVAGAIAETAANSSWEDVIARTLFRPLNITTAGFGPMGTPGKLNQPLPHNADGRPVDLRANADNPPVMGPAGRVHLSLPDWSKFVVDQLKGAKGRPALLKAETYKPLQSAPFPDTGYTGGGWISGRDGSGRFLGHDGSNTMNYATAHLLLDRDLAVLVAVNQGGDAGQKACAEARQALIKQFLG